jgi:excisionase family DNA binding protein
LSVRENVENLKQQGFSQSQIGRMVGVSRERVRQIIANKSKRKDFAEVKNLLLSTGDVARLLNVHPNTVRRWSRDGLLKTYRLGPRGDRRFMREDVQKMLEQMV